MSATVHNSCPSWCAPHPQCAAKSAPTRHSWRDEGVFVIGEMIEMRLKSPIEYHVSNQRVTTLWIYLWNKTNKLSLFRSELRNEFKCVSDRSHY